MMGGSNQTINLSFEYGGTAGEKFRFYILNSHTATNRGIEPLTLGHSTARASGTKRSFAATINMTTRTA
ncbi:MAG: hypothetical protein U0361_21500 [Nitrospiraceae bacterium]